MGLFVGWKYVDDAIRICSVVGILYPHDEIINVVGPKSGIPQVSDITGFIGGTAIHHAEIATTGIGVNGEFIVESIARWIVH